MTSVPTPEALLPCPFCGTQPLTEPYHKRMDGCVSCANGECIAHWHAVTPEIWNRRSPSLSAEGEYSLPWILRSLKHINRPLNQDESGVSRGFALSNFISGLEGFLARHGAGK